MRVPPALPAIVVLIGAVSSVGAHAASLSYRLRGVAGLPASARIELARAGEPAWRKIDVPGRTLRSILAEECGTQGAAVDAELQALTLGFNGGDGLDRVVERGSGVAVPFCLKVETRVRVPVEAGDSLEGLLRDHYGVFGPATRRATHELNDPARRWPSAQAYSQHLKEGDSLLLPFTSEERVFVPRRGRAAAARTPLLSAFEESIPDALASLPGEDVAQMARAARATEAPAARPPDPFQFEYVDFVPPTDGSPAPCAAPEGPPFDRQQLRTRLAAERAAVPGGPRRATAGVIDSGLGGLGGPFFATQHFAANPSEADATAKPGEDDDVPRNGYVDDIYGMNLNSGPESGSIADYPNDPKHHSHGSQIASVVLGGRSWVSEADEATRSQLRLKIVNFSSSTQPGPVGPHNLGEAIEYLKAQGAEVVNMSLSNGVSLEGTRNALRGAGNRILFVVAAGNDPQGGKPLALAEVFPARYGGRSGDLARTLVTVGAHDGAGKLAAFSNYSPEYVDLLAPGCHVETVDATGAVVEANGTSLATAFVTFAAGLISSLGETNAANVKNRLLAGVDVDAQAADRSWSAGRLNIVKAISIRHDVVQLRDSHPFAFGRLSDPAVLGQFCGDKVLRPLLDRVRKIRPNLVRDGKAWIEYWVERDGRLAKASCLQRLETESIGEWTVDGQLVPGPSLSEIEDIVLATRPPGP